MDRGMHCVGEDSLAVIPGPGVELGGVLSEQQNLPENALTCPS